MPRTKYFNYNPAVYKIDDIVTYLESKGVSVVKSKLLAHHADDVVPDWEDRGYKLEKFDISIGFPEDNLLDGFVGRVDCRLKSSMKHDEKENNKLFNNLKRKFETS